MDKGSHWKTASFPIPYPAPDDARVEFYQNRKGVVTFQHSVLVYPYIAGRNVDNYEVIVGQLEQKHDYGTEEMPNEAPEEFWLVRWMNWHRLKQDEYPETRDVWPTESEAIAGVLETFAQYYKEKRNR